MAGLIVPNFRKIAIEEQMIAGQWSKRAGF